MTAYNIYMKLIMFYDECENVYCYGNGFYARIITNILKNAQRPVTEIVVTKVDNNQDNVECIYDAETRFNTKDGLIFAMNQKNTASTDINKYKSIIKCLYFKDWELQELSCLEYYKTVGRMNEINIPYFYIKKLIANVKKQERYKKIKDKAINPWFFIPKYSKPICTDIVKYILTKQDGGSGCIVELGCGLCDIIGDRRLKKYNRVGLDIDERVIKEASIHYKDIELKCGTFDSVNNIRINYLLTIDFTHEMPKIDLQKYISDILKNNDVECYIVDEVSDETNYQYIHNIMDMLPEKWYLDKTIGVYPASGGVRWVKAFVKK